MATYKGICLVVSVKCTENGQWPHVILNPGGGEGGRLKMLERMGEGKGGG